MTILILPLVFVSTSFLNSEILSNQDEPAGASVPSFKVYSCACRLSKIIIVPITDIIGKKRKPSSFP
jgi:hypothetical protein